MVCGLSVAGCGSGSLTRDQTWAPAWGLQKIATGPPGKAHDCFRLCFHLLTQDAQVLPSPAPSPQVEGSLLILPACQIAAEAVAAASPRHGLCWWLSDKRICLQRRDVGSVPGSGRSLWRREWLPTPVFLPRESHGRRRLAGYTACAVATSQTELRD